MNASELEPSAAALYSEVMSKALQIPAAPFLLPRMLDAIEDPNKGADELEQLIGLDPGVSSATLRLANSSWFGLPSSCDSLREAIFRLGAREVYQITATSLSVRWMVQEAGGYGWEPGDFCRHSLAVAFGAQLFAERTGIEDPLKAYTAGLLHDIGKLAMAHALPYELTRVRDRQLSEGGTWIANERAVFGFDHTQVSSGILTKWSFPESLIIAARFYAKPSSGPSHCSALLAVIHAAKQLAVSLGVGVGEEGFLAEADGGFLRSFGITEAQGEEILPEVCRRLERMLGNSLSTGRIKLGDNM